MSALAVSVNDMGSAAIKAEMLDGVTGARFAAYCDTRRVAATSPPCVSHVIGYRVPAQAA